jgi:hypothetical protein
MNGPLVAVDGTSIPRARADVASVTLNGEAVIHRAGQVHVLDPVATLVWRCCDGDASVDEIARELAEVFAVPAETVHRDVAAVVSELESLGLLAEPADEANPPEAARTEPVPDLLVDPPGSCASCADKQWRMRSTYRIGSRLVTVGTDRAPADAAMRQALAAHLAVAPAGTESTPPLLAVTWSEPVRDATGGDPQPLHLLQRGDTLVARSRRPADVVRALAGHLATYGDLAALGLATVGGVVVGAGDQAVIVPEPEDPIRFRRSLARHGVRVADLPVAIVDPVRGEAVVGAPGLTVDLGAIDGPARDRELLESAHPADALPWGRYRVVAMAVPAPATRAGALLAFGPRRDEHRDQDATFAALLALLDLVPVVEAVEPDAVAAWLAGA